VKVDGRTIKQRPTVVQLKPGLYGVGVWSNGHFGAWERVKLSAGERRTVTFDLTPTKPKPKKKK
jgi:hypothetical protein